MKCGGAYFFLDWDSTPLVHGGGHKIAIVVKNLKKKMAQKCIDVKLAKLVRKLLGNKMGQTLYEEGGAGGGVIFQHICMVGKPCKGRGPRVTKCNA